MKLAAFGTDAVIEGAQDGPRLPGACAGGMLGVRPEHVELAFERGLRAGVTNVEYLGADSLVVCMVGSASVAVRVPGAVGVAPGEVVWLRWPDGAAHFFSADGRRGSEPQRAAATAFA
jgi:sn-glycerol 3-phosphate transport system ATP-binding protein